MYAFFLSQVCVALYNFLKRSEVNYREALIEEMKIQLQVERFQTETPSYFSPMLNAYMKQKVFGNVKKCEK